MANSFNFKTWWQKKVILWWKNELHWWDTKKTKKKKEQEQKEKKEQEQKEKKEQEQKEKGVLKQLKKYNLMKFLTEPTQSLTLLTLQTELYTVQQKLKNNNNDDTIHDIKYFNLLDTKIFKKDDDNLKDPTRKEKLSFHDRLEKNFLQPYSKYYNKFGIGKILKDKKKRFENDIFDVYQVEDQGNDEKKTKIINIVKQYNNHNNRGKEKNTNNNENNPDYSYKPIDNKKKKNQKKKKGKVLNNVSFG